MLTSLLSPGAGGTCPLGAGHLCPGPSCCPWLFLSCIIAASLLRAQLCVSHPRVVHALWSGKQQREQDLHLQLSPLSETLALGWAMTPMLVLCLASWTLQTNGCINPDTCWSSFYTQIEKTGKSKRNSTFGELSHDHPTPTAQGLLLRDVFEHCQAEEGIDLHLPLPGIEEFSENTTLSFYLFKQNTYTSCASSCLCSHHWLVHGHSEELKIISNPAKATWTAQTTHSLCLWILKCLHMRLSQQRSFQSCACPLAFSNSQAIPSTD